MSREITVEGIEGELDVTVGDPTYRYGTASFFVYEAGLRREVTQEIQRYLDKHPNLVPVTVTPSKDPDDIYDDTRRAIEREASRRGLFLQKIPWREALGQLVSQLTEGQRVILFYPDFDPYTDRGQHRMLMPFRPEGVGMVTVGRFHEDLPWPAEVKRRI